MSGRLQVILSEAAIAFGAASVTPYFLVSSQGNVNPILS
jgi:hypothetical protein